MELTTGTSYNPQFGDTGMPAGFSAFGQTDHNIHGYIAEAGETISFSSSAGLCSLNDCCFEECEKTQHGTVDQKFDLYDADMNKIAYYDHSTTVTFENAGQCVPRASERRWASERLCDPLASPTFFLTLLLPLVSSGTTFMCSSRRGVGTSPPRTTTT